MGHVFKLSLRPDVYRIFEAIKAENQKTGNYFTLKEWAFYQIELENVFGKLILPKLPFDTTHLDLG